MSGKIMSINAGSSSLKFQLFEMPEEKLLVKGLFERIGAGGDVDFTFVINGEKKERNIPISSHKEVVDYLLKFLFTENILHSLAELKGVGHRVSHGGDFKSSVILTDEVEKKVEELCQLAPLHNPVNLVGIRAFREDLPDVTQAVVFDTSFHQTMPEKNYVYPLPYELFEEKGIRKYGFHGTSHQYVAEKAAKAIGEKMENLKIISCHLGSGMSICGIKDGKSFDTSMGFTPLAGLMMSTRSGDIDPSIVTYLQKTQSMTADEVEEMMNKKSGLLGVSGISPDTRDVMEKAREGNPRAKLAIDIFAERVKSTIGAYAAEMGGVDVLIFTAGVGENSPTIREMCCEGLEFMNIRIDPQRNKEPQMFIQKGDQPVYIMVIPTNEELKIAQDTYQLVP